MPFTGDFKKEEEGKKKGKKINLSARRTKLKCELVKRLYAQTLFSRGIAGSLVKSSVSERKRTKGLLCRTVSDLDRGISSVQFKTLVHALSLIHI